MCDSVGVTYFKTVISGTFRDELSKTIKICRSSCLYTEFEIRDHINLLATDFFFKF
jgi:hypothetical protein